MSVILTPFAKLVLLFYHMTGSYGVSIILFCLVIRLILFPIFLKGRKSMLAMSGLGEEQKRLQQKYAKDRQKYSEALQELYAREGVKPSSGCLWSFLPLPFMMALYAIIRQPLTYLMSMTSDQFSEVSNFLYGSVRSYKNEQLNIAQDVYLRYNDIIQALPDLKGMEHIDFTFLGMNMSSTPHLMFWKVENWANWSNVGLWLIPIISAALGLVSMFITNSINAKMLGNKRGMDPSMKSTLFIMPLFSLWLCFTLPAALGVYWIANSVFAIVQEYLNIPFLKKYLAKQKEEKCNRAEEEKLRVKREKQVQAEAKKKAAEEMKRIQMERKLNKSIAAESRVGIRSYARGRLYDPERYEGFPYRDPNEIAKEQFEQMQKQRREELSAKQAKKNKRKGVQPDAEPKETRPAITPEAAGQAESPVEPTPAPSACVPEQTEPKVPEEEGFVEESFPAEENTDETEQ